MNFVEYTNNLINGMTHDEMLQAYNLNADELYKKIVGFGVCEDIAAERVYGKKYDKKEEEWGDDDLSYLKKYYATKTNKEIAKELGKSVGQIIYKGHKLGLKKTGIWTEEKVQYLINNHNKKTYTQIAKDLGISCGSVSYKAKALNLRKPRLSKKWTKIEIEFLRKHYKSMTHKEMAHHLSRSRGSVIAKCNKLGLKKELHRGSNHTNAVLSEEDVLNIMKKLKYRTLVSVAEEYRISPVTIHAIKTGRTWSHVTMIKKES